MLNNIFDYFYLSVMRKESNNIIVMIIIIMYIYTYMYQSTTSCVLSGTFLLFSPPLNEIELHPQDSCQVMTAARVTNNSSIAVVSFLYFPN